MLCDLDIAVTSVGCHLLGATAFSSARFGAGSGPIVMDDVLCTSSESRLIDCPATFNHNCVHSEDASVRCTLSTTGNLKMCTVLIKCDFLFFFRMYNWRLEAFWYWYFINARKS